MGYVPPVQQPDQVQQKAPGHWLVRNAVRLGCLAFVAFFFVVILYPVFRSARLKAQDISCESNEKQLGLALLQYANDNNDRFPPASQWETKAAIYVTRQEAGSGEHRNFYHCPVASGNYGYAVNKVVGNLDEQSIDNVNNLVLIFETDQDRLNANGSKQIADLTRHYGRTNMCFSDSHVKHIYREIDDPKGVQWAPSKSKE